MSSMMTGSETMGSPFSSSNLDTPHTSSEYSNVRSDYNSLSNVLKEDYVNNVLANSDKSSMASVYSIEPNAIKKALEKS